MSLTLRQATTIVEAALRRGRETGGAPLAVAVLDAGALAGVAAAALVGDPGA